MTDPRPFSFSARRKHARVATRIPIPLLAILVAWPGLLRAADCSSESANLVAPHDCGFSKGIAGWKVEAPATVSHDPKGGDPEPGALLAGGGPQGSVTAIGPCLRVEPTERHAFAAHVRLVQGTAYFCAVQLFEYNGASCETDAEPLAAQGAPPDEDWKVISADGATGSETASLQVRLVCSGEPGFVVSWDDVYVAKL